MYKILVLISLITSTLCFKSIAQSTYSPLDAENHHLLERYEIKYGKSAQKFSSNVKPYQRRDIANLIDSVSLTDDLSNVDRFNLTYLQNDNWEWTENADNDSKKTFLKKFYRKKSDFFHVHNEDFDLHVNPVIHFDVGKDSNSDGINYINTRGIQIRGMIDQKVGFYTYLTDTQAKFPKYVQNFIKANDAVPGEGYYKDGDTAEPTNVDFLTARGYLTLNVTKNIDMQFGHDKNFIGNGHRSLILSDFSSNYLFLKINTKVWKLHYQNLFTQMTANVLNADGLRGKKYMTHHHLGLNVTKNLNIGLFESVVYGQRDTVSNNNFELNYLNPIIFYRFVEQQIGSADNALIGLDFKWNLWKRVQLYGQLMIDELQVKEVMSSKGWWGNKQAFQIGMKYIDVLGISNLDIQGEVNVIRPYTYSQNNNFKSYTNYHQPLAHPIGANLVEGIGIIRYQPFNRLRLSSKLIYTKYGADDGQNRGSNVLRDNTDHQEYGNKLGQGIKTNIIFMNLTATYQIKHNLFVDATQVLRTVESELDLPNKNTTFSSLALRLNIAPRVHEF